MRAVKYLVVLALLAAGGWWARPFIQQRIAHYEAAEEAEAAPEGGEKELEPFTVEIEDDVQEKLGLDVVTLEAATMKHELTASGQIMDPAALVQLDGDLAATEVELANAKSELARGEELFKSGQGARKDLDAAGARFRTAEVKLLSLRRQLASSFSENISSLSDEARSALVEDLLARKKALARVDLPAGEHIDGLPAAARVTALGGGAEMKATAISAALTTDAKTQGQGFILQLDAAPAPGTAIQAALEVAGDAETGVLLPRSALLRFAGDTWVYLRELDNPEIFVRTRVVPARLTGESWLVTQGLKPGDIIVTTGTQSVLAAEQNHAEPE